MKYNYHLISISKVKYKNNRLFLWMLIFHQNNAFKHNHIFSFYNLILFSVLGFGFLASKIFFKINLTKSRLCRIVWFIFFIDIFLLFSLFYSHNYIHNAVILLMGLFLFVYFIKDFDFLSFKILLVVFLFLFLILLLFKTHDDFHYYHFPYTYYITQHPLLIGVGQFNHGFRTPSSIFYLNSLFYLPIAKYYLFYVPTLLIMGFSNRF